MNIEELIPHRDPFLWVNEILESSDGTIKTANCPRTTAGCASRDAPPESSKKRGAGHE